VKFPKLFFGLVLLSAVISACSPSAITPQANQVATVVAQTMQALTPAPSAGLLPHSLYYMNDDSQGVVQVFRLDADGKTLHQITFEPVNVDVYDVSTKDGSVAYVSGNNLLLVDVHGAGRRVLMNGGAVNDNNRWTNEIGMPVFSPDGQTLAFAHDGLNFYTVGSGAMVNPTKNQMDTSNALPTVKELYSPSKYSPDGSKLLINIGYYEGGTQGIYNPADNTILKFHRSDQVNVCCNAQWTPDGSGLYAAYASWGMVEPGLFYIKSSDGSTNALLPGAAANGSSNFADAPMIGPDGRLYFFFNNISNPPQVGTVPLYMVKSNSDGVTNRVKLRPETFANVNEFLWSPDARFAILAYAPAVGVTQGGQAVIEYADGKPSVVLADFALELKWGP
jgi:Tol biopolymer transport system component